MTQTLSPLFGEFMTDQSIARAAALRAGWTCRGVINVTANASTPANIDIAIMPDPSTGFFAWRTHWNRDQGTFQIVEDASVVVGTNIPPPAAGQSKNVLILGRWRWVPGPIGSDGKPTGVFTPAMMAIYATVEGASGVAPTDPTIPSDLQGRADVVLARVVLTAGAPAKVQWVIDTNLDLLQLRSDLEHIQLIPGAKGDKGDVGAPSTVAGPKGDPGATGAKGDPGPQHILAGGLPWDGNAGGGSYVFTIENGILTQTKV